MNNRDGKERIYRATMELLAEEADANAITVQQIAQRAGVAVGMINYHFGSKRSLLIHVAKQRAYRIVEGFQSKGAEAYPDPVARVKALFKVLFDLDPTKEALAYLMFTLGPLQDDLQIPLYVVSLLGEIAGKDADEGKLRVLFLQLFEPIYSATCLPAPFRRYSGVDIYDKAAREAFIDQLVDNVVKAL